MHAKPNQWVLTLTVEVKQPLFLFGLVMLIFSILFYALSMRQIKMVDGRRIAPRELEAFERMLFIKLRNFELLHQLAGIFFALAVVLVASSIVLPLVLGLLPK